MNPKEILRIPMYILYYGGAMPCVVTMEWISRKELTFKESIKEFLEVKFFD